MRDVQRKQVGIIKNSSEECTYNRDAQRLDDSVRECIPLCRRKEAENQREEGEAKGGEFSFLHHPRMHSGASVASSRAYLWRCFRVASEERSRVIPPLRERGTRVGRTGWRSGIAGMVRKFWNRGPGRLYLDF